MLADDTLWVVLILLAMLVMVSAMGGGIRYREDFEDDEDMSVGLLLQHDDPTPAAAVGDETLPLPAVPAMPSVPSVPAVPVAKPASESVPMGIESDDAHLGMVYENPLPMAATVPMAAPSAPVPPAAAADDAVPDPYFGSEYYPVEEVA